MPDNLVGWRDRALVLVGCAGAFRRSEVAGLLERAPDGILVHLARSKGDRAATGTTVHVPGKHQALPGHGAAGMDGELLVRGITGGAVFRVVERWGNVGDAPLHLAASRPSRSATPPPAWTGTPWPGTP